MVWAYLEGAAEDQVTLKANREAFSDWALRARVLSGTARVNLRSTVAGVELELPVLLAPTGLTGLVHSRGELAAARAAERAGSALLLSTGASYSLEEVSVAAEGRRLFQLYPWARRNGGTRELSISLMERAIRCGYSGLVVTVDAPAIGNREEERRNGMGLPPVLTPVRVMQTTAHPRWAWGLLTRRRVSARNLVAEGAGSDALSSIQVQYQLIRPDLVWEDLSWIREVWTGPLLVKGILDPADAEQAVNIGAEGVIVSNHGGRQLDGALASLEALPGIVARIGDRAQVLIDGGIRRGTDVIKALSLGADAVCIGRSYLYGLACRGEDGVAHVLDILREEMVRAMTLMGCGDIAELGPDWLVNRPGYLSDPKHLGSIEI
jgi:L-lactate dehydrogenase (cytochrome)/(S)-mandelate dehydrogenase